VRPDFKAAGAVHAVPGIDGRPAVLAHGVPVLLREIAMPFLVREISVVGLETTAGLKAVRRFK
jgi:hypothetical protein